MRLAVVLGSEAPIRAVDEGPAIDVDGVAHWRCLGTQDYRAVV